MQWVNDALCREIGHDPFFPDYGNSNDNHMAFKRAIEICKRCPVQRQCYEYALNDPSIQHGIWGGRWAAQIAKHRRKEIA